MRRITRTLPIAVLMIVFLVSPSSDAFGQDEAWISEFTVDGEPPPENLASAVTIRPKGALARRGLWDKLAGTFTKVRLAQRSSAYLNRAAPSSHPRTAVSPGHARWTVLPGAASSVSAFGNVELDCRGGARSWNPDADVYLVVTVWVQGAPVAHGYGFGPAPTAVAHTTISTVGYDRSLACTVEAGTASAQATGTILADCGDNRTVQRGEYFTSSQITPKPECDDFINYVPHLSHYVFLEWNSSPTYTWAILKAHAVANLYCVVANYGSTPAMNSGYRNPAHNNSVSTAVNSQHIHGTAADLDTPAAPDDTAYNYLRSLAKSGTCDVACVEPRNISPAHFHVDYRGACPADW